jgi:hypothetical protein
LKPIAYADLSKGCFLLFFICHDLERPLRRRSKWIQVLKTLQGEYLNSFLQHLIEPVSHFLSISPLNISPVVGVDHAPTTTFATEALSPGPPTSVPVLGSIPVPEQFGSASGGGLETPPTVSDHAMLTLPCSRLSLLITGHLAQASGFGHP